MISATLVVMEIVQHPHRKHGTFFCAAPETKTLAAVDPAFRNVPEDFGDCARAGQ
ncbi:MAG: hypothetical protein N2689_16870 [Verrucomicrobiae bacterium]|nr:hypothetical protein [Verrucomicrobiae bacterium]